MLPFALFALSFFAFQIYYLSSGALTVAETYAAYAALYASLLAMLIIVVKRAEGSGIDKYGFITFGRRASLKVIGTAVLLTAVFLLVSTEPGFIFGFTRLASPSILVFGFFLFTAPLVAFAEEALFRGYIFKRLAGTGSTSYALLVSSALYAILLTNPHALGELNVSGVVQYLFTNTFAAFVLGIVMCLYFYKSGWSLLGPVVMRTGLLLQSNLSPLLPNTPSWEFTFVFEVMGSAAVIAVLNAAIREPKFLARKYLDLKTGPKRLRFLQRARIRRGAQRTLMSAAVLGIVVISCIVGFQAALGSTLHLVAIPTGSMRPTLYPGTLVVVQSVSSPAQIKVGDIIEFAPSYFNGSIVHRVISEKQVSAEGAYYTTKGDNNTSPDPMPIPFNSVSGKVVFEVPYLGFLVLSPPLDIALVAFLLMSSLLGSSLRKPKLTPGSGRG
jgi:signal peptidase